MEKDDVNLSWSVCNEINEEILRKTKNVDMVFNLIWEDVVKRWHKKAQKDRFGFLDEFIYCFYQEMTNKSNTN